MCTPILTRGDPQEQSGVLNFCGRNDTVEAELNLSPFCCVGISIFLLRGGRVPSTGWTSSGTETRWGRRKWRGSMKDIPHGRYRGRDADGVAQSEADHLMGCPDCGWFDKRDLGEVFEHIPRRVGLRTESVNISAANQLV
jgi:hypothetical protein